MTTTDPERLLTDAEDVAEGYKIARARARNRVEAIRLHGDPTAKGALANVLRELAAALTHDAAELDPPAPPADTATGVPDAEAAVITLRKPLLAKLRRLSLRLPTTPSCPPTRIFCFDGTRIVATNERIAMSVPHTSDFIGVLPARILPDLLAMSTAPAVEIRTDGEGMVLVTVGDTEHHTADAAA